MFGLSGMVFLFLFCIFCLCVFCLCEMIEFRSQPAGVTSTTVSIRKKGDVGGVCPPGGDGGGRRAFDEHTPGVGGQLHQGGGAVPLHHHLHARGDGPGAVGGTGEPGAEEKRGCAREKVLRVVLVMFCCCDVFCFFSMSPRLDVDAVGPVTSRGAALPAPCRSETTRLPPVQEFGNWCFFVRQDFEKKPKPKRLRPRWVEGKWKWLSQHAYFFYASWIYWIKCMSSLFSVQNTHT